MLGKAAESSFFPRLCCLVQVKNYFGTRIMKQTKKLFVFKAWSSSEPLEMSNCAMRCVHGAPEPGSSVQGGRSFVLATSQDSNQDHGPVCSPQRCHMANLATLQPCPCCQPPLPSISRPILRLGIGSCCDALGLEPSL